MFGVYFRDDFGKAHNLQSVAGRCLEERWPNWMCSRGQVVEKYDFCVRHKCWCKSGNTDPKMHILINSLCSGCVCFLWSLVLMSQSVGTGKAHSLAAGLSPAHGCLSCPG